jgi:phage terminase large subunit-like protein
LSLLISFEPGLETLNNPTQIFLSKDFEQVKKGKNNETVESKWFEVNQIKELYSQGFFLDSLTIIGLQALLLQNLK